MNEQPKELNGPSKNTLKIVKLQAELQLAYDALEYYADPNNLFVEGGSVKYFDIAKNALNNKDKCEQQ